MGLREETGLRGGRGEGQGPRDRIFGCVLGVWGRGAGGLVGRAQGQRAAAERRVEGGQGGGVRPVGFRRTKVGWAVLLWRRGQLFEGFWERGGGLWSPWSVGEYTWRCGLTAQKPLRRAYEQNPAAVRCWLRRDYPTIVAAARRAHGTVFWGDETCLRSDDVRGRGYARREGGRWCSGSVTGEPG